MPINQCLSPLTLWVRIPLMLGVHNTTLCDQVCQWLATVCCFFPYTPVSSTNKTDCHDITEILLKVALNTITISLTYDEIIEGIWNIFIITRLDIYSSWLMGINNLFNITHFLLQQISLQVDWTVCVIWVNLYLLILTWLPFKLL